MKNLDINSATDISNPSNPNDLEQLGLKLPNDVKLFMDSLFTSCNLEVSKQLSIFPNTHEETLDLFLISHLAKMRGPIKLNPNWILRLDAHFIGRGRHYRSWEVADIGLMVVFRKRGKIVRSKLVFLQSKKLYANNQKPIIDDRYDRQGMGRVLVTDDEHEEINRTTTIKFSESCRYKALKFGGEQHNAMEEFANLYNAPLFYLFYNPVQFPWRIDSPVEQSPLIEHNKVGCRILPTSLLNSNNKKVPSTNSPSYSFVKNISKNALEGDDITAGWRIEYFVNELFVACKEGVADNTANFEILNSLLRQKSSPISSAISIAFDMIG